MFSALSGHTNVLFEETLHRYITSPSSSTFPTAQTVASVPSLFTDPHRNSFQMDSGAHWSRRIEPNPKILPRILREPAARDFQSRGESQPLKGCPEPCLQGRREEMAQQSAKRDSATHLLKHVGTLQTFDEGGQKKAMNTQYRYSIKQQQRAGFFKKKFRDRMTAARLNLSSCNIKFKS